MGKMHYCDVCNYTSPKKYNYDKHLESKKHQKNISKFGRSHYLGPKTQLMGPKTANQDYEGKIRCNYCDKYICRKKNIKRHYNVCIKKKEYDIECRKNKIIDNLIKEKNKEIERNKLLEQEKKQSDRQLELLRDAIKSNYTVNNNNNNVNMFYIMNNYCSAKNYDEIMNQELSKEVYLEIKGMGAKYAPTKLLEKLCIDNVKPEDRSIHCVDIARNKFMFRRNNKWLIDDRGANIIDGLIPFIRDMYITNCAIDINNAIKEGDTTKLEMVIENQKIAHEVVCHRKNKQIMTTVRNKISTKNIILDK